MRPLLPADFTPLYRVGSDPLIWEQHPAQDRHRVEVFREFFDEALRSGGALAVETVHGALIGSSRFELGSAQIGAAQRGGPDSRASDGTADDVEIGWTFLARSHWGGETNRELKALMLGHAFRWVERVVFRVGPDNRRSQRALEKLGATAIGECAAGSDDRSGCRRWRPCTERCARDAVFVITRDDWLSG